MSRKDKSVGTERLVVTSGWGNGIAMGGGGVTADGYGISFSEDEYVLKLL